MFTKDPENGTFKITVQATAPGELQCISWVSQLARRCYQKKDRSRAPYVRLSVSEHIPNGCFVLSYKSQISLGSPEVNLDVSGTEGPHQWFYFMASPTVLSGWCEPSCIEQKFPCRTLTEGSAVLDESGHYSRSIKGSWGPIFKTILWGLVLLTYSSHA